MECMDQEKEEEILAGRMNDHKSGAESAKTDMAGDETSTDNRTMPQTKSGPERSGSKMMQQKNGELKPLPLIREKIVIQFRLNSNEIEDQSYAVLNRIATYLAVNNQERVNIKGYTDDSGPVSYNESVSRFRANAVKSYLIGKGANPGQITVFGMGAKSPMASNATAEGRRLNRRVEIEFTQIKAPSNS